MKQTKFLLGLVGVLAFFAACGEDRAGGDSETNWMKLCDSTADCGSGTECLCGMCSKSCTTGSQCSALEGQATCASSGERFCNSQTPGVCVSQCSKANDCPQGFECAANGCIPVPASGTGDPTGAGGASDAGGAGTAGVPPETGGGVGGEGGAPPSDAGATCIEVPRGSGGASSIPARVPAPGTPCRSELEGFELCTPLGMLADSEKALSACRSGLWVTLENPSDCERPHAAGCEEPGSCMYDVLECNHSEAANGVCCDVPRYCENLQALCDGDRWWTSLCGDGIVQEGEDCDDGVDNGPYPARCTDACKLVACGNGQVEPGEECDYGPFVLGSNEEYQYGNHPNAACLPTCSFNRCGDGEAFLFEVPGQETTYEPEECDDGNDVNGDGCDEECRNED
ncbi:MAG: hypothetical protein M3020_11900 [Myxococcota bacterium]|nr:hypothetical protein [Myxococcota bacterium]